jgi:hypothetical protein
LIVHDVSSAKFSQALEGLFLYVLLRIHVMNNLQAEENHKVARKKPESQKRQSKDDRVNAVYERNHPDDPDKRQYGERAFRRRHTH